MTRRKCFIPNSRVLLWMLALLALPACEQQQPAGATAAANPSQFAAARDHSSPDAEDGVPRPAATTAAPGVGMRQGRLRGLSAAHLGVKTVLAGAVSEDGTLLYDRLDSVMNMELVEYAIAAYSTMELPSEPHAQLACYCNAYNANALAILTMLSMDTGGAVLRGDEPIERVNVGESNAVRDRRAEALHASRTRFDDQPVLIGNTTMSMRELREERILGFNDPRVLAYLIDIDPTSRAPRESLWPRQLDEQLDALCATWVNDGALVSVANGEVHLGWQLQQHASAFEGETFGDVLGFLRRYARPGGALAAALGIGDADPNAVANTE